MAKIEKYKGYDTDPPIPKPNEKVLPNIVTVRDGMPVTYPNCNGIGVRILHPSNPKAPAQNMSVVMFYVPPHVELGPGTSHYPEECYAILRGKGIMTLAGEEVEVESGMFIHLPPWCEHGIKNTGDETMEILICTSPPNP